MAVTPLLPLFLCIFLHFYSGVDAAPITGVGLPDDPTFSFERAGANAAVPTCKVADTMCYETKLWLPNIKMDFRVEMLSSFFGDTKTALMNVLDPNVTVPSTNYPAVTYGISKRSFNNDGRIDQVVVNFGDVENIASDPNTKAESEITIAFCAVVVYATGLVDTDPVDMNVGIVYDTMSKIWVSEHTMTFVTDNAVSSAVPAFSMTGPSTIGSGNCGQYLVNMTLRDAMNAIVVDVYAPLNETGVATICKASIVSTGSSYAYHSGDEALKQVNIKDDKGTLSIDFGMLYNTGFRTGSATDADDTITLAIYMCILNTTAEGAGPYHLGVSVLIDDNKIWSGTQSMGIGAYALDALIESPVFDMTVTAKNVLKLGSTGTRVNMTLPKDTQQLYRFEIALPSDKMVFCGMNILHVGRNFPCFSRDDYTPVYSTTSGSVNDYAVLDFEMIYNSGQWESDADNTITIEVCSTVLNSSTVIVGDTMDITTGVYHAGNRIYVGKDTITVVDVETLNATEPTITIANGMPDLYIREEGSTAYFVTVFYPPAYQWSDVMFEAISAYSNITNTTLASICKVDADYIGRNIIISNTTVFNSKFDPSATNNFTRAVVNYGVVSNIAKDNWDELADDNKVIIRVVVTAQLNDELTNGTELLTTMSVQYSDKTCWVSNAATVYNTDMQDYDSSLNLGQEPLVTFNSAPNSVHFGEPIFINSNLTLPIGSVSTWKVSAVAEDVTVRVCQIAVTKKGNNVAPCWSENSVTQYTVNGTNRIGAAHLQVKGLTNVGVCRDKDNTEENTVTAQTVFVLDGDANNSTHADGSVFDFSLVIEGGSSRTWVASSSNVTLNKTIPPVEVDPSLNMTMSAPLGKGTSGVVLLEITIPPNSFYDYTLEVVAPCNSTNYGKLKIYDIRAICAGSNVPCVNDTFLTKQYQDSENAGGDMYNRATLSLGHVGNIAGANSALGESGNKVMIEVVIGAPADSTALDDEVIPICGGILVNAERLGVMVYDVQLTDTIADSPPAICTAYSATNVTELAVAGIKDYFVDVSVGLGSDNISLDFNCSTATGDLFCMVENIEVVTIGENVAAEKKLSYEQYEFYNGQTPRVAGTVGLGVVTNVGTTQRYCYSNHKPEDDVIKLKVTLQLGDSFHHYTNTSRTWSVGCKGNGFSTSSNFPIDIIATGNERSDLSIEYNVDFDGKTGEEIIPGVEMNVTILVKHTVNSTAHAYNAKIHFRKPKLLVVYDSSSLNVTGTNTIPTVDDNAQGVTFTFPVLYFTDSVSIKFTALLDPNRLIKGVDVYRIMTIPADVTWCEAKRTDTNEASFPQLEKCIRYTPFVNARIEIYLKGEYDSLGMESGAIQDCQIFVSSGKKTSPTCATTVRLSASETCVMKNRGFKDEYVQVCPGNTTFFSGISIQADDAGTYVKKFKIKYSSGVKWRYVSDVSEAAIPQVFEIGLDNSSVEIAASKFFLPFRSQSFEARCVRVIPVESSDGTSQYKIRMELYGRHASTEVTPSAACDYIPMSDISYKEYPRHVLVNKHDGKLFACVSQSAENPRPACSAKAIDEIGWTGLDDNLARLHFIHNKTGMVYGYDIRDECLRSDNNGYSFKYCSHAEATRMKGDDQSEIYMVQEIPDNDDLAALDHVARNSQYAVQAYGDYHFSVNPTGIVQYNSTADLNNDNVIQLAMWTAP